MLSFLFLNLYALVKFVLFTIVTLLSLPFVIFGYFTNDKIFYFFVKNYFKICLLIFNTKVAIKGNLKASQNAGLYVSNHLSYLDIIVYGAYFPFRYTPKAEIGTWPIIKNLVNLSKPIYIDRDPRRSLEQKKIINNAINQGGRILVFPEGTTGDGSKVLPFKSSLFAVVEQVEESQNNKDFQEIAIIPISIKYTKVNNITALQRKELDKIAWYGDMYFMPHFWQFLKLFYIKAEININDKKYASEFSSRKEIAKYCQKLISNDYKNKK